VPVPYAHGRRMTPGCARCGQYLGSPLRSHRAPAIGRRLVIAWGQLRVPSEDRRDPLPSRIRVNCSDCFSPTPSMSIRCAEVKCCSSFFGAFSGSPGWCSAAAASPSGRHQFALARRGTLSASQRPLRAVPLRGHDLDDLWDYLARPLNDDRVADPHVLAAYLVFVVQRGAGDMTRPTATGVRCATG